MQTHPALDDKVLKQVELTAEVCKECDREVLEEMYGLVDDVMSMADFKKSVRALRKIGLVGMENGLVCWLGEPYRSKP